MVKAHPLTNPQLHNPTEGFSGSQPGSSGTCLTATPAVLFLSLLHSNVCHCSLLTRLAVMWCWEVPGGGSGSSGEGLRPLRLHASTHHR